MAEIKEGLGLNSGSKQVTFAQQYPQGQEPTEGASKSITYTVKFYPTTYAMDDQSVSNNRQSIIDRAANNTLMQARLRVQSAHAIYAGGQEAGNVVEDGAAQIAKPWVNAGTDETTTGILADKGQGVAKSTTIKALQTNGPIHNAAKEMAAAQYDETASLMAEVRYLVETDSAYSQFKGKTWAEMMDQDANAALALYEAALFKHREKMPNGYYQATRLDAAAGALYSAFSTLGSTHALWKSSDRIAAALIKLKDDEKNDLVNSDGTWNNKNLFEEQLWLLKNLLLDRTAKQALAGGATLSSGLGGKSSNCVYLFAEKRDDTEFFNSCLLHRSLLGVYNFLPTTLHALLVPKIQLFIEELSTGDIKTSLTANPDWITAGDNVYRRLVFDEHISKKDLEDLVTGKRHVVPGTGLVSLKLEDKASNAAEIRKNYVCNLKVHSNSIKDFYHDRDAKDTRASFSDLWFGSRSGNQLKKLILQIGFQIPPADAISSATGYSRSKSIDVQNAIAKNNLTFRLFLQKYNLGFKQNGAVEFDGTYQAAQASMIFDLDVFPIPHLQNGAMTGPLIDVIDYSKLSPGDSIGKAPRGKLSAAAALDLITALEERRAEMRKELKTNTGEETRGNRNTKRIIARSGEQITYIRNELQALRFSSVMSNLLQDSNIQAVKVSVDSDGALQPESATSSLKPISANKISQLDSAAKQALANARSSTKRASSAITATNYHNIATESDTHLLAYVPFGAILESLNKSMANNYLEYFRRLKEGIAKRYKASGKTGYKSLADAMNSLTGPYSGSAGRQFTSMVRQSQHLNNYAIHLGKAEIRFGPDLVAWCNIGEIPIAIPRLIKFLQGVYSSVPGSDVPFSYGRFLERAINELILEPLNSYDFSQDSSRRSRSVGLTHRAFVKKLSCNKEAHDKFVLASAPKGADKKQNILVLGEHNTQNTRKGIKAKPRTFSGYSDLFRNSTIEKLKGMDTIKFAGEMDVYYLAIESISPVYLQGNLKENLSKGIYHFIIGQDAGILKSVNFEQKDIQGRQEVIMLSEREGTDMLLHFDVKLKTVGNSLFSNGDLVFLDPGFHLEKGKSRINKASLFGLGGYYYITKVNHILSRDGFETELIAKWITESGINVEASRKYGRRITGSQYGFMDGFSYLTSKPAGWTMDHDSLKALEVWSNSGDSSMEEPRSIQISERTPVQAVDIPGGFEIAPKPRTANALRNSAINPVPTAFTSEETTSVDLPAELNAQQADEDIRTALRGDGLGWSSLLSRATQEESQALFVALAHARNEYQQSYKSKSSKSRNINTAASRYTQLKAQLRKIKNKKKRR